MYFITFIQFLYTSESGSADDLFRICNKYRELWGKKPQKRNNALDKAALMHAKYCAQNKVLSDIQKENNSDTPLLINRINKCGYDAIESLENYTWTSSDKAQYALNVWKDIIRQRKILLNDLKEAGYASAKSSNNRTYWIAVYATRNPKPSIYDKKNNRFNESPKKYEKQFNEINKDNIKESGDYNINSDLSKDEVDDDKTVESAKTI